MPFFSDRRARLIGVVSLLASSVVVLATGDAAAATAPFPVTATIPVGHDPSDVAVDPGTNTLYVTNRSDDTVSAIDEATNTVTATVGVGRSPQAVAVDPGLHAVYVANSGDDTVSVIDDQRNSLVATLGGIGAAPTDIAVDPGTHMVYTANEADNTVSVIVVSASTGSTGYRYSHLDVDEPTAVAVDPVRHTAYVTSHYGTVAVIDEASNTITATIAVDRGADDLTTDPGSGTAFVGSYDAGTTSVIDETTNTVTDTFGFAYHHGENYEAYAVALDPALRDVYVSNGFSGLYVLDETTGGVIGSAAYQAHGRIAVDANTHAVYVTDDVDASVAVVTPTQVARPSISASLRAGNGAPGPSATVPAGTPVTGSATLSGPNAATASGTVTYTVYGSSMCGPPFIDGRTVDVVNGSVPPSPPIAIDYPDTYYWQVTYGGDESHAPSASSCNALPETVTSACPATPTVDRSVSSDHATSGGVITAPALTTSGNQRLLLAFVEADGPAAPIQAVTRVTGGGLTWTLAARSNRTWGTSEVWQAHTTSPLSGAVVSATLAKAYHAAITVAVLHTSAAQVGNVATASGTGGPATDSITPRACGSLIMAAGHDWTHARAISPADGQSLLHLRRDTAAGDSFWTQRFTAGTVSTEPVSVTAYGPSGDRWTVAAVEIPGT